MQAEIISIGDELTSGQRLDTNSQWLAQRLSDLGIYVLAHSTISDDLQINIDAFRLAARRADIIVCTGGLGPTKDDLTRESLAAAFDLPLETYPEALAHIERLFQQRQRPMPERNKTQALFPSGSRIIPNPYGTAPGIDLSINMAQHTARFFALPGVPIEMKQMWEGTVLPRLLHECGAGKRQIRYATLKCFGIGESEVEVRMPDLIARDRVPRVGITASRATITLRIAAEGDSLQACQELMAPTIAEIRGRLGNIVYSEIDEELPDTLIKMLHNRHQSLATVELGEAALLGYWLAEAQDRHTQPTTSRCFQGSIYLRELSPQDPTTNVAKLDPAKELQHRVTIAHQQFNADWVVGVGPYPRVQQNNSTHPSPQSNTASPPELATIDFIVSRRDGQTNQITHQQISMSGHPDVLNHRIAKTALDQLRYSLLSSA